MTISELIEDLGGPSELARIIGVTPSGASEMKRRGSIRPRYWPTIIAVAQDRGLKWVDAEQLMAMHVVSGKKTELVT